MKYLKLENKDQIKLLPISNITSITINKQPIEGGHYRVLIETDDPNETHLFTYDDPVGYTQAIKQLI